MIGSHRRYCLLKSQAAYANGLKWTWRGKQESITGTALDPSIPHQADLLAIGYSATEDLAGATLHELVAAGLDREKARDVVAML